MRQTVSCCLPWLIKGSVLVKWPELTMTSDRQGAVAVCKVGCQQSFDWFEGHEMCKCMGEIPGNVHELATEILRTSGIASAKEKLGEVREELKR